MHSVLTLDWRRLLYRNSSSTDDDSDFGDPLVFTPVTSWGWHLCFKVKYYRKNTFYSCTGHFWVFALFCNRNSIQFNSILLAHIKTGFSLVNKKVMLFIINKYLILCNVVENTTKHIKYTLRNRVIFLFHTREKMVLSNTVYVCNIC